MKIIKRTSSRGGFSIPRTHGGIRPLLQATTTVGRGLDKDFYENTNVRHPFESLGKKNEHNALKSIKIKSAGPAKRYISFNM